MHVMGGWDKHGFLVKMFPSIQNNEVGLADYLQLCRVEIEDISKDFFLEVMNYKWRPPPCGKHIDRW